MPDPRYSSMFSDDSVKQRTMTTATIVGPDIRFPGDLTKPISSSGPTSGPKGPPPWREIIVKGGLRVPRAYPSIDAILRIGDVVYVQQDDHGRWTIIGTA